MEGSSARTDPGASSGTLAFLFTDLAGSTRLWERHPEAMRVALARHDEILREAIAAGDGRIVKTTGDGLMAIFPSAAGSVAASLAAQRDLAAETWPEATPLRVRMGVHAGEAELRADDYFGPTVNRTARIMAVAQGGQVLLSAAAAALAADRLPDGASLLDLGEHRLKDLGRPERVFQLVHPDLAADFPPLVSAVRDATDLPAQGAPFIGRAAELAALGERLGDGTVRLLTLTGPGGTGKTSLAVQAAAAARPRFPDGVRFVDLSSAHDPEAFLVAVARAVGLAEVIDRSLMDELTDRLRDQRMLLVLDNFEQLAPASGLVAQLLRDLPALTVLATSREALHVRAEQVFAVPPLTLPPSDLRHVSAAALGRSEAVQLFVDRARATRPDFELTDDNAAAVAEICRRLDGLPLAIELAAARLRLFSPEALRDRLGRSLELLRSGSRDLPERQQTLRATIEWSYQLLDPNEQRLFEALAAFADADVSAVEAVVEAATADGTPEPLAIDAVDGLASLLDKSLVRQVDGAGDEPRLTMLETIREYAAERLDERGAPGARVRRAHAVHYADLALRLRRDLGGGGRDRALAALAVDAGNLRIAWAHWMAERDLDQLTKLADSLLILNDARSWYLDTVALTTDLLAVLETVPSSLEYVGQEIALRTSLARALMATRGYTPEVEDALARALQLFEGGDGTLDDEHGIGQHYAVLRGMTSLYMLRADFEEASRLGQRILELGERHDDSGIRIDGQLVLGSTLTFTGDLTGGLRHLEDAIASFGSVPPRSAGYRSGAEPRVICLTTSAFALWLLGLPDRAAGRVGTAIELAAELDHPFTSAYARFHAGLVHLFRREPHVTLERAIGVLEIADEHDLQIWTAVGSCLMGVAQAALGRADEGLAQIHDGLALYQGMRTPPVFWPMLRYVEGVACLHAGRLDQGLGAVEQGLAILGDPGGMLVSEFLLLKADLLAAMSAADRPEPPERLYREAFDRAVAIGARTSQLRAAARLVRAADAGTGAAGDGAGEGAADAEALAGLVAGLTEGFETLDVIEARQVLRDVASA